MSENPDNTWVVRNAATLGTALRQLRRQAGLTQEQLATEAGLHRSYLSDLEQGKVSEQTERLLRVLRRLGAEMWLRQSGRS